MNLIVASNFIREKWAQVAIEFGVTLPQHNVLRILRGAHPEGHPRCEIAGRMLDRAPDVTRIIDRLEQKTLVKATGKAATGVTPLRKSPSSGWSCSRLWIRRCVPASLTCATG